MQDSNGAAVSAPTSSSSAEAGNQEPQTKSGGRNDKPEFGQPIQEGPTAEETKNSQVQESEANPASSSQTGSERGEGSEEEEQEGQDEEGQGSEAAEHGGGDEEGGLPKLATGQEEDEGPEAIGELCSCADLQLTIVKVSVVCCGVLCCAVLCCAVLCCAVLHPVIVTCVAIKVP